MSFSDIRSFSAPGAFTRDIVQVGNDLWVADLDSKLYRIAPDNGLIRDTYPIDFEPRGITYDGANLWVAQENAIHRFDLSGNEAEEIAVSSFTPIGLDWDGENLWAIDDTSNEAKRLDRSDGSVLETVALSFDDPVNSPQGIIVAGGNFHCHDFEKDTIEKFGPSGDLLLSVDPPIVGPFRGLDRIDGDQFWACQYSVNEIYLFQALPGYFDEDAPTAQEMFDITYADAAGREPLATALQQRTPAQNLADYLVSIYAGTNPRIVTKPVQIEPGELDKTSPAPASGDLSRQIWIEDDRDPNFAGGRWATILGRSGGADPGTVELTLFIADNAESFVEPT